MSSQTCSRINEKLGTREEIETQLIPITDAGFAFSRGYSETDYAGEFLVTPKGILEITQEGDRFIPYPPGTRAISTREGLILIGKDGKVYVKVNEPNYGETNRKSVSAEELGRLEEGLRLEDDTIVGCLDLKTSWGFHTNGRTFRLAHKKKEDPILTGERLKEAVQGLSDKYYVQIA